MLGLAKEAASPQAAHAEWLDTFESPPAVQPTQDFVGDFLPSEEGYPVRLLDGKMSRLRFRRDPLQPIGFLPEWRVANRSFPVPNSFSLESAVRRVTSYFSNPQETLEFTPEATQWHMSFQGGLNVRSHLSREQGDTAGGARLGAAPWQVGILAALLLVYGIFCGYYTAEVLSKKDLKVIASHLQRAFSLLKVAWGLVSSLRHSMFQCQLAF